MQSNLLSVTYFNHFVRYAEEQKVDLAPFWRTLDHDGNDPFITLSTLKQLVVFLWSSGCPKSLGLEVGKNINLASHGHVGYGLSHMKDLEESLVFLCEYYKVRAQILRFRLEEDDESIFLCIEPTVEWGEIRTVLYETIATLGYNIIKFAIGKKAKDITVEMPFEQPSWSVLYSECLSNTVSYGHEILRFEIPLHWKSIRCVSADPATSEMAAQQCRLEMARLIDEQSLSEKVNELISSSIQFGLSLEQAAKTLYMSKSTFIRKLKQEDTSFKQLMEAAKKRHAQYLLINTSQKIESISLQLGYEDLSNFGRSFKRWFGCSPSQFREQQSHM
jgi:AraC-like DNA-binding protein